MDTALRTSDSDDVRRVASRLAKDSVTAVTHAASGGNSRIYRVETTSTPYALKYYPPAVAGARDRLGAEVAALEFMRNNGVSSVPQVYGYEGRFALYSWMEGQVPKDISAADVDAACDFLAELPRLSRLPDAVQFPLAAEACLSLDELLAQLMRRMERLQEVAATEPALKAFLNGEFANLWWQREAMANAVWEDAKMRSWEALAEEKRCLIPADFGFHNILKKADGALSFIDFEYFGWDDQVKLVCDTLLHPGYVLGRAELAHAMARLTAIFAVDTQFTTRLRALLPLFSLRWALILCNEFLPEKRANRAFAAASENGDEALWNMKKQVQLAKAEAMLNHAALGLVQKI